MQLELKKKKNKEQIWKPILTDGGRNNPKKKFGDVLEHRDEASSAPLFYSYKRPYIMFNSNNIYLLKCIHHVIF